ncbi:MAG TPA: aminopeptidase P family N-terminal domain-containing protein, partial [Gemmatimonadaceae bacterium]
MKRREFLRSTAALTAITAMPVGSSVRSAGAQETSASVSDPNAPAGARGAPAPAPISESEREERREKARKLMGQLGFSAMLIEPGANMNYFAGIEWGRSERLFAFLLPVTGKPVVISPAFEQQRAEDQVNGRYDVRV